MGVKVHGTFETASRVCAFTRNSTDVARNATAKDPVVSGNHLFRASATHYKVRISRFIPCCTDTCRNCGSMKLGNRSWAGWAWIDRRDNGCYPDSADG